jgi:hypothetical protein
MKALLASCGIIFVFAFTTPAAACQQCYEYFDYQAVDWCLYCTETNCGFEECNIVELNPGEESCSFAGEHCFTVNRHCPFEPQGQLLSPQQQQLSQRWRLARVRVTRRAPATRKG